MIETRRTCVIAMAHITETTAKAIFAAPTNSLPYIAAPLSGAAIMVYAHTENGGDPGIPADLWAVMTWARAQNPPGATLEDPGFEYVLLDRDAEAVDLPVYDGDDLRAPEPPPWPWKREPVATWVQTEHDGGAQRSVALRDANSAIVAYVIAGEDDAPGAAAVAMIEAAPEVAERYAALVKLIRKMGAELKAHDDRLNDGTDDDGPKAPDGDDYNEAWSTAMGLADAAERIIAGR